MRIPFIGRLRRGDDSPPLLNGEEEISEADRNKQLLIQLGLQITLTFMLVMALGYWAVSAFLGTGVTVPRSAEGVLESVETPAHYSWSSEAVRQADLGGSSVRQDSFRSAVVDPGLNKVQVLALGVFPERTVWLSDGTLTARLSDTDQTSGRGWRLVTNACAEQPAVPAKLVTMPSPKDLLAADPKLVSDEATVFGERAWVMSFKPTADILKRAFWIEFFDAVTTEEPSDRRWVLSAKERESILAGDIKLDYAFAWVTREGPRELRQIEFRFFIDDSKKSGYRFLLKTFPDEGRPLADATFGQPDCNSSRIGDPSGPGDTGPGVEGDVPGGTQSEPVPPPGDDVVPEEGSTPGETLVPEDDEAPAAPPEGEGTEDGGFLP